MFMRRWVLVAVLLLQAMTSGATTEEPVKVLRVYGPGGPHHVFEECADLFSERHGVDVVVIRALPHDLEQKLRQDGDIYYGGADYMLEEFNHRNPGVIDMESAEKLHPRRIGIIVRKGNPFSIKGIDDLRQVDVNLLDVKLENMRTLHSAPSLPNINISRFEYTGKQGLAAWRSAPELDAWITYKSWHVELEDESEFIAIPGDHALRFTPVALTQHTPHRQTAMQFIAFLKSPEARQIFIDHGWE